MNLKRATLTIASIIALSACLAAQKKPDPAPTQPPAQVKAPTPTPITDAAEMEAISQIIIEFQDSDNKLTQADAAARLSVAVPLIVQRQKKQALDDAIAAAQKKHNATGCQLDFKSKTWANCPAPTPPADAKPATPAPATGAPDPKPDKK